jgi:hypothetical protein
VTIDNANLVDCEVLLNDDTIFKEKQVALMRHCIGDDV